MAGLHTGDTLDHYRIENLVARSGMASIFRATDLRTDQTVALKIPHPEMEADVVLYDRFKREQDIGQKLNHPNVMKVLTDDHHSQIYMAMEWVEGRLLREIIREKGKLPVERAMRFAARIADAATSVMTHICAIFFISFSLSSVFVLACSLYYGGRAGLDETIV